MNENMCEDTIKAMNEINALAHKIEQIIKSINVFDIFDVHQIFPKDFYDFHEITDITVYGLKYTSTDTVDDKLVSKITNFDNIHDFAQELLGRLIRSGWLEMSIPILNTRCYKELRTAICYYIPQCMILNTANSTYSANFEPVEYNDAKLTVEWKKIKSIKSTNIYDNMLYQRVEIEMYPYDTNSHVTNTIKKGSYKSIETAHTTYSNNYYVYTGTVIGYDNTFIVLQNKDGAKRFVKIKDINNIKVLTNY